MSIDSGIARTVNEMPHDRITDRDGSWYLRHVVLASGEHHAFLLSERAPEGTRASDLRPAKIELLPGDEWDAGDPLVLSTEALRGVMDWPPDSSPEQPCDRLLVGQGGDTWDPRCGRPSGHEGRCEPA